MAWWAGIFRLAAGPHTVAGPCRILTGFRVVPPAVVLLVVNHTLRVRGRSCQASDFLLDRTHSPNTKAIATTMTSAVPSFMMPAASCWSLSADVPGMGGASS